MFAQLTEVRPRTLHQFPPALLPPRPRVASLSTARRRRLQTGRLAAQAQSKLDKSVPKSVHWARAVEAGGSGSWTDSATASKKPTRL